MGLVYWADLQPLTVVGALTLLAVPCGLILSGHPDYLRGRPSRRFSLISGAATVSSAVVLPALSSVMS
jgi:hypothetical protein